MFEFTETKLREPPIDKAKLLFAIDAARKMADELEGINANLQMNGSDVEVEDADLMALSKLITSAGALTSRLISRRLPQYDAKGNAAPSMRDVYLKWGFSERLANALVKAGSPEVEDLRKMTDQQLRMLPIVGPLGIKEIRAAIDNLNTGFKP